MVSKADIGSDAVSSIEAESAEGKEQLVETSCQDVASGECDGKNIAHVSSANAMDLPKEECGSLPSKASKTPLVSVEMVQKLEPEKTTAASELSLPSAVDVVCSWGRGEDGQLGHGDANERRLPLIISVLDDCEISSVTSGADHIIAWSESTKTVYSWGWGDFGRLGHGNSSDLFIPRAIRGLKGLEIKQIVCGDSHYLAITGDREVHSWGQNQNGQLGLRHSEDVLVPNKVETFEGIVVKMLAARVEHTAAVTENGKLYGWGWGQYGNLGLGDRNDRHVPGEVAAISGEKMNLVICGWRHTIAVFDLGKLYTFG